MLFYMRLKSIFKDKGWLKISQKQFIIDALARFGLQDVHPKSIPVSSTYTFEEVDESCALDKGQQKLYMEKVGTLNYLATQSKASIAWVTSKLGQYMHQADMHHMQIADGVYAYLKGSMEEDMTFWRTETGMTPMAYSDASHADQGKTGTGRRRSQSGCAIMMGGSLIAYHSRGQKNVTLSTAESEYVALSGCTQEVMWTRRVLSFLGFPVEEPTVIYEDNEAAEALACNEIMTKRSRFIDARFHYVREMVAEGEISVQRCATTDMVADLFTKGLPRVTFEKHWNVARGQEEPGNLSLGAIAALTRRSVLTKV